MHKKIISVGAIALIVGGVIGYTSAKMLVRPTLSENQNTRGGFGTTYGGVMMRSNGGGLLSGIVAAKDATSITLNTRDGSSRVVLVTSATTVSKSVNGSVTDVSVGSNIIVSGTTNSDGSIVATLLQLRPETQPIGR